MTTVLLKISEIQSSLNNELRDVRSRIEKCGIQGSSNSLKIEKCEIQASENSMNIENCEFQRRKNCLKIEKCDIQGNNNSLKMESYSKKIELLEKKFTTELSRCHIREEEAIPYVFSAPLRNRYFAGRTEEIQKLKRVLQLEETLKEKRVRVAAVCGLGGVGKTSLASDFRVCSSDEGFLQGRCLLVLC